jgi:dehydrogenase/reductase SDR family member 7B
MNFENKVVVITGATGGMGSEIVALISKEKCKMVLLARNEKKLKELSDLANKNGSESIYKKCDISKNKEITEAVQFIYNKYKMIDVVILSTGVLLPNPIDNLNFDPIKKSMEINFYANYYFFENLLPILKKQKSSTIAIISTLADKRGTTTWGAYQASKAALSTFFESLRYEAKQKFNIKIILIRPGTVETPMIQELKLPYAIQASKAAKYIIKGIKKDKKIIEFPLSETIAVKTTNTLPSWFFDNL